MAVLFVTKHDIQRGVNLNMEGRPVSAYDPTFDSYLLLKQDGGSNHTLTLVLNIFLDPVSTFGFGSRPYPDWDKDLFWIRDWPAAEWQRFQTTFKQQCQKWNGNFWLTPPRNYANLDVAVGRRKVRPNIYCHLFVNLVARGAAAHRTIKVVNLDKNLTARALGVRPSQIDGDTFRSDSGTYDSLDVIPRTSTWQDNKNRTLRAPNYLTIVHEIGHALGLPHIGVSHRNSLCQFAIALSEKPSLKDFATGIFKGGASSGACYGSEALPQLGANVMGSGTKFDWTNAQPWRDRIAEHTATNAADWTVSMRLVPPRPLP